MPYGRRKFTRRTRRKFLRRRRKTGKKKYSTTTSKLRDKKINTLVEKRMQAISRKEALKLNPINWIASRGIWQNPQPAQAWDPLDDQWPALADWGVLNQTQFYAQQFCRIGGYLNTNFSDELAATGVDLRSMFVRIKHIKLDFRFTHANNYSVLVDMQVCRIPYDKQTLIVSPNPVPLENPGPVYQDHRPFTSVNTISRQALKYFKQPDATQGNMNRRVHVLARKRIIMAAPKMIDNATAGGADRLNTVKYHTLKLNKFFKGLGRRERYKIEAQAGGAVAAANRGSLADNRYFLSFRCTAPVQFLGVTIVKFCADSGLDRQVIFDRLAPNNQ